MKMVILVVLIGAMPTIIAIVKDELAYRRQKANPAQYPALPDNAELLGYTVKFKDTDGIHIASFNADGKLVFFDTENKEEQE